MKRIVLWLLLLVSLHTMAEPLRDLRISNPKRSVGYVVGEVFKRTLELEVTKPYTLSRASLPAEGVTHAGIELRKVEVDEKRLSETTHYRITLTYQVFAHSREASKIRLPAQSLQVTANGKSQRVPIPAWSFRISPLAALGEADIEKDMSPYRAPLQVQTGSLKPVVGFFLVLVLIAVLGLIYINADKAWFPGMGGPFSMSYRRISSLENSPDALNKAITSIQNAFYATFGENLFAYDIDRFLQKHPEFTKLRDEIDDFFNLTSLMLFGIKEAASLSSPIEFRNQYANTEDRSDDATQTLSRLMQFCRACRDCERGVA
ncbi:MAG TPA: hypothetical protein VFF75_03360 [Methylophilaceae bacterium]|nr:hypothetical protein [Methylophilaceae bacterium]